MDIRELKLLAEFKHPNIVRLVSRSDLATSICTAPLSMSRHNLYQLGIAIPDPSLKIPCMVVTELCEKGDLFDYIVSLKSFEPSRRALTRSPIFKSPLLFREMHPYRQ